MAEYDLRDLAREQITAAWEPDARNLQTAASHTDYFGANLAGYTEALSDIDLDWAKSEFANWSNGLYPSGFAPHYLSKPHYRGIGPIRLETSRFDRRIQGTTELPNGEHVTDKAAPPNWAIAAKTIADRIKQDRSQQEAAEFVGDHFDAMCRSSLELYLERGTISGRIWQIHKDELTLRDGCLADRLNPYGIREFPDPQRAALLANTEAQEKRFTPDSVDGKRLSSRAVRLDARQSQAARGLKPISDTYIQALLYKNDACLQSLADEYLLTIPDQLLELMGAPIHAETTYFYDAFDPEYIENWLGRLTIADQFELSDLNMTSLIEGVARLTTFESGVPTYVYGSDEVLWADNMTDQGSVNHALSLQVGNLLIRLSRKDRLGVPLQDRARQIGCTIIEKSVSVIARDGFVRQSDPNASTPKTARTGLGQRVGRSQPVWTPTAVAIYNTLPELNK